MDEKKKKAIRGLLEENYLKEPLGSPGEALILSQLFRLHGLKKASKFLFSRAIQALLRDRNRPSL